MKITFNGHATFTMESSSGKVMIDPFITDNPLATNKDLSRFDPDVILVTHGHGDHVADVEAIAKQSDSLVITNYEVASWLGKKGVKTHPLNHGGKKKLDIGTVKYVNAIHTSGLPDGSYGGNPGGFVVWDDACCYYHAGDTALTLDMKLIPMTCPKLDFAILPIGDNFTMGYEDAAIAAEFIQCDKIIGCHYNTFGYIEIDVDKARSAFKEKGKELILLDIEESIEL